MITINNRYEIIERINNALYDMEHDGMPLDEHYYNLKSKRDTIVNGKPYCTYNITPYLISYIASYIPDCNMGTNNKIIKGRGDKKDATLSAVIRFAGINNKENDK